MTGHPHTTPMTLTLIGDSLTAGNLGIPYLQYLSITPDIQVHNRGRDGDTVQGVFRRLDDVLRSDGPEILVIQVGANDILLPEMSARGGNWTSFVEQMTREGITPSADIGEFSDIYTELIGTASTLGVDGIVCATIPPIGEVLETERNRLRVELNRQIRESAGTAGIGLADVAEKFESILKSVSAPSEWFFGDPADFITDIRTVRRSGGAMALSKERGLILTMDGAHLNERGGELMAQVISHAIGKEARTLQGYRRNKN